MANQPTQSGEIKEERKHSRLANILFDALVMIVVAAATFAFFRLTLLRPENQEINNPNVVNKIPLNNGITEED